MIASFSLIILSVAFMTASSLWGSPAVYELPVRCGAVNVGCNTK